MKVEYLQFIPIIERATEKITASASADRNQANTKLENAVAGCDVDADLTTPRERILGIVFNKNVTQEALSQMALRVGAPTQHDGKAMSLQEQQEAIGDRLANGPCDLPALNLIASDFANYVKLGGGQ